MLLTSLMDVWLCKHLLLRSRLSWTWHVSFSLWWYHVLSKLYSLLFVNKWKYCIILYGAKNQWSIFKVSVLVYWLCNATIFYNIIYIVIYIVADLETLWIVSFIFEIIFILSTHAGNVWIVDALRDILNLWLHVQVNSSVVALFFTLGVYHMTSLELV